MSYFINLSNHPSSDWSSEQMEATGVYGRIVDIPFPQVSPLASKAEIEKLAEDYTAKVLQYKNPVVMVQGEFNLTYCLVRNLKLQGIKVVAGCAERVASEEYLEDGTSQKLSLFRFVQFREY